MTEQLHFHFSIFTFHFHALEKEMATHSSVLAWRIPRMAEPGGLPSMGSHRVRHDKSDLVAAAAAISLLSFLWRGFKAEGLGASYLGVWAPEAFAPGTTTSLGAAFRSFPRRNTLVILLPL